MVVCEVHCVICPTSKKKKNQTLDVACVSFSHRSKAVLNIQLRRWEWFCGLTITSSQLTVPEWENTQRFKERKQWLLVFYSHHLTHLTVWTVSWWVVWRRESFVYIQSDELLSLSLHGEESVCAELFFYKDERKFVIAPKVFREWFEYCSREM